MSDVVESVETSFKQLVAQKPYRSVTVKEICERAFISRRTFYANFVDKRAIVAYLFKRDAVKPVNRALELLSADEALEVAPIVLARFYKGVLDERDYYYNLVKPMASVDSTFELVVARAADKLMTDAVLRYSPQADKGKLASVSYYHAAAQAIFMEKWICDGFEMSPEGIGELQIEMLVPAFRLFMKGHPLL